MNWKCSFKKSRVILALCCFIVFPKLTLSQFTIYNTANSGIPANQSEIMRVDSNNNLWLGTNYGLTKFDGVNWTVYNASNSVMPFDDVRAIDVVSPTEIWFSSLGPAPGLCLFNGTTVIYLDTINGLPSPAFIWSLKKDHNGILWIGADFNTYKYDGVNLTIMNGPNDPLSVSSFAEKNGVLWAGTPSGLYKYQNSTWSSFTPANSGIPSYNARRIAVDTNNIIWIGDDTPNPGSSGITRFDGTSWLNYNQSNSGLASNTIYDLQIDDLNNVWIASYSGGLGKYDGVSFSYLKTQNSNLPTNSVFNLCTDNIHRLWVGTNQGLCLYQIYSVGIEEGEATISFNVYPNPVTDKIYIDFMQKFPIENFELRICNSLGEIEKRTLIDKRNSTFDLADLPGGIYFLEVLNLHRIIKVVKISVK